MAWYHFAVQGIAKVSVAWERGRLAKAAWERMNVSMGNFDIFGSSRNVMLEELKTADFAYASTCWNVF
jgi:hypothetical protein